VLVLGVVSLLAVAASSLVFSAMHHVGAEEAPDPYLFWYRFGAGVVLSGIFLGRGFAVAAWTHFLYDVMVLLLGR
jgi:membrane protease YdiL (CAAX protease family)